MPRNNAANQQRFRDRQVVILTAPAKQIAAKLLAMPDQTKLKKIVMMVAAELKKRATTD